MLKRHHLVYKITHRLAACRENFDHLAIKLYHDRFDLSPNRPQGDLDQLLRALNKVDV